MFFLEMKNNLRNLYNKLSVSGWQRKRERPEAWKDNKKCILNHVEISTGSCPVPHEMTFTLVCVFGAWSSGLPAQMPTIESWSYLRNLPMANSGLYRKTDLAPWLCAQVSHGSLSCLYRKFWKSGRVTLGQTLASHHLCAEVVSTHISTCPRPPQSVWTKKTESLLGKVW
jgi:hypothetical protein